MTDPPGRRDPTNVRLKSPEPAVCPPLCVRGGRAGRARLDAPADGSRERRGPRGGSGKSRKSPPEGLPDWSGQKGRGRPASLRRALAESPACPGGPAHPPSCGHAEPGGKWLESEAGWARAAVPDRYRPGSGCEANKWEPDTETRTRAPDMGRGAGTRRDQIRVGTGAPAAETRTRGGGRFQRPRTPQARSYGAPGTHGPGAPGDLGGREPGASRASPGADLPEERRRPPELRGHQGLCARCGRERAERANSCMGTSGHP